MAGFQAHLIRCGVCTVNKNPVDPGFTGFFEHVCAFKTVYGKTKCFQSIVQTVLDSPSILCRYSALYLGYLGMQLRDFLVAEAFGRLASHPVAFVVVGEDEAVSSPQGCHIGIG